MLVGILAFFIVVFRYPLAIIVFLASRFGVGDPFVLAVILPVA